MRLRKTPFIWLAALVILAGGMRAYQARISSLDAEIRNRYALVTARLSVFDALSQHDSLQVTERIAARDSILTLSGIDSVELNAYVNSFETHAGGISQFWKAVRVWTDSFIALELQTRDTTQIDTVVSDSTSDSSD